MEVRTMSNEQQENKKQENKKKNKVNYFFVTAIIIIVTAIIQIVTAQFFSREIIRRNFVSVDTSKLIELERLQIAESAKNGTDGNQLFEEFKKFITDLRDVVEHTSKSLNVIVLEKGAVVSSDIYDLTDVIIEKLNKKGYKLDLNALQKYTNNIITEQK